MFFYPFLLFFVKILSAFTLEIGGNFSGQKTQASSSRYTFFYFHQQVMHTFVINSAIHSAFLKENRKDPVTADFFSERDEIVFCRSCGSAFLKTSWEYMGKKHCGQTETLVEFPEAKENMLLKTRSELLMQFLKPADNLLAFGLLGVYFFAVLFVLIYFDIPLFPFLTFLFMTLFPLHKALKNVPSGSLLEMRSNGIFEKNIFQRITFSSKKKLLAKNDNLQILFCLTLQTENDNKFARKIDIWGVCENKSPIFLSSKFFYNIDRSDLADVAMQVNTAALAYPVTILTQVWHDGFVVGEFTENNSKFSLKINDLSVLKTLSEYDFPVETSFGGFNKIYYCDSPVYIHEGSLNEQTNLPFPNENGDVLTVSQSGIWRNQSRENIEKHEIKEIILKFTDSGFKLYCSKHGENTYSFSYDFYSPDFFLEYAKAIIVGLHQFTEESSVRLTYHGIEDYSVLRTFINYLR